MKTPNKIRNIFFIFTLLLFAPLIPFSIIMFFLVMLIFLGSPVIAIILAILFDSFLVAGEVSIWMYGTPYVLLFLQIYTYIRYSINI